MSTQLIVRIEPELKQKVSSLAKNEGKTTSEIVRELLEDYVRDRDVGAFVDSLWGRIGQKLTLREIGPDQIQQAIKDARKRK